MVLQKRKRASVLSRKEEAASLEQELLQIEEQIRSLTASLENLEKRVEEAEKERGALDESYQHTNLLYVASETKVQNIQNQMDRKKRVLREEEQRLLQIDIDLASTTANLKDQETALASLQVRPRCRWQSRGLNGAFNCITKGTARGL